MNRFGSKGVRVLCVSLALAVFVAGCGNAKKKGAASDSLSGTPGTAYTGTDFTKNQTVDAPGVSSTEIHVGSITSKTNPLGTNVGAYNDGLKAYFDYVNGKGGIYGRKIKLTSERDDQTGANDTQAKALLSQDNVYAAFIATELFSGAPTLQAALIPTFGWNINAEWGGPKNFFPNIAPQCLDSCQLQPHITPWVVQQVHAHKVAVLAYNVAQSASCAKNVVAAFKQFGSQVDAQVVYDDESLSFGQTDYSAQISQVKAKGADFLTSCMDYNGDYAAAKEMQKEGIAGKVTYYHPNLYDPDFVAKNAAALNGGIVQVTVDAFEHQPANDAVKTYLDYAKAHNVTIDEITAQGWISGLQFFNALKAAGPNFTWSNLIQAWNQQKSYSGGGWVPAIDWTTNHDPGKQQFECANFVKIENGKFVPIWDDGGKKPWVCFNGLKPTVWQTPVNVSFDGAPFNITDVQH